MSTETRSSSALFKRAEQLRRWEESETSRESPVVPNKSRKIKFSSDCVFLAACAAGDKEEVQRLLQQGADIDTANVDGLTSLHQACIDDNLDMVEFLVSRGADVNRGDNEGWTPLHATASCGFISIAKYLIENGGDVAAVNNDGDLPLDIAESDEMEDLLQQHLDERGINCEEARNEEERMMLSDAKEWLSNGEPNDTPHPKTGATALHVAAAKGYIKVLDVLLQGGLDVNVQDFDGWTPLHAAAHWGQREACESLVEHFCDMDMKNYVGQTPFDVADSDMVRVLDELRKKQNAQQRDRDDINSLINKKSNNLPNKRRDVVLEKPLRISNKEVEDPSTQNDPMLKVKVEIQPQQPNVPLTDDTVEKKNKANRDEPLRIPTSVKESIKPVPNNPTAPSLPPKQTVIPLAVNDDSTVPAWRRPSSFRNRGGESMPNKNLSLRIGEKEVLNKVTSPTGPPPRNITDTTSEVSLRRTQSFEADEKRGLASSRDEARLVSPTSGNPPLPPGSCVATTTTTTTVTTVSSPVTTGTVATTVTTTTPHNTTQVRSGVSVKPSTGSGGSSSSPTSTASTPTTPGGSKLSPGNIFKNFFKSFVPPVRDEESETQRKAHAKRVRETRRSTQGVTLEEIKSAEQLVKKKQQQQLQQATQQLNTNEQPDEVTVSLPYVTATITTGEPTTGVVTGTREGERRPSWRLRVDNGSKFMLEDARVQSDPVVPEVTLRRGSNVPRPLSAPSTTTNNNATSTNNNNNSINTINPSSPNTVTSNNLIPSSPTGIDTAETTVTLPLRRPSKLPDDKEQDKENDVRNAQATQAVIQRRRRPKRRSTGVVHVDMDEIDPDRQESGGGGGGDDENLHNSNETGSERTSRLSSISGDGDNRSSVSSNPPTTENGELDYKKLYEESQLENEILREKLRKTEQDLQEVKTLAEKSTNNGSKVSLSEIEKRERRAMERKLSEMEEELKQLQKLKAENERLRTENRALTRVVSKLTASVNATK
ncbi:myosin binding subunit isoform X3 [Lycorma delicatula]|uniref:myosin binding subunit isoform X3 n=1 Tax=Lycorma delicatula TaxID=130591 RepID=UPI003F51A978